MSLANVCFSGLQVSLVSDTCKTLTSDTCKPLKQTQVTLLRHLKSHRQVTLVRHLDMHVQVRVWHALKNDTCYKLVQKSTGFFDK